MLRRASGGGTVLQGPGCLSYALVLPLTLHPQLANIRSTNQFILERMASTLHRWEPGTDFVGTSDLAIDGRKFQKRPTAQAECPPLSRHDPLCHAGHSHRAVSEATGTATEYREDRPHGAFLRTIDAPSQDLKRAIAAGWGADRPLDVWPEARLAEGIRNVRRRSEERCQSLKCPSASPHLKPLRGGIRP